MRYYKITCRRGHVGFGNTAYITFYFAERNAIAAMNRAKRMPGVKHSELPINTTEITHEEFAVNIQKNAYVTCHAKV